MVAHAYIIRYAETFHHIRYLLPACPCRVVGHHIACKQNQVRIRTLHNGTNRSFGLSALCGIIWHKMQIGQLKYTEFAIVKLQFGLPGKCRHKQGRKNNSENNSSHKYIDSGLRKGSEQASAVRYRVQSYVKFFIFKEKLTKKVVISPKIRMRKHSRPNTLQRIIGNYQEKILIIPDISQYISFPISYASASDFSAIREPVRHTT